MRRLILALAIPLVAAPAASAHSLEIDRARGDVVVRASADGEAALMVSYIGRGARIVAPRQVTSIRCVDGRPIYRCARLRRGKRLNRWRIIRPVRVWHKQEGAFAIAIRGAKRVRGVAFIGGGTVVMRGTGSYEADGNEAVSYAPGDRTVSVTLEP